MSYKPCTTWAGGVHPLGSDFVPMPPAKKFPRMEGEKTNDLVMRYLKSYPISSCMDMSIDMKEDRSLINSATLRLCRRGMLRTHLNKTHSCTQRVKHYELKEPS
jgi:hypothetical protein